jgi:acyl-CoA synthetase (AMP-forming)/AMP-acid ligase II
MTFLGLQPSGAAAMVDASSGEPLSFHDLLKHADAISALLGPRKQLVFLLSRNDRFSGIAYVATQLAGHAVALLDGSKPLAGHADVLAAYRPDWIAGPGGTADALGDGGLSVARVEAVAGGELLAMSDPEPADLHNDLAVMLATSGTTGSSKYVRLSAANVEANARSIASYLGLTPSERPITSLPIHYSFGLSVLNSHWLSGAAVVVSAESVMQRGFWDSVAEHRCTSLAGVPYTYQMLERVGYRDMDLPSVTTMLQAGGALDRGLTELYGDHMARKGGRFFVMYGQTEATARIAFVPPDRLADKLGSAGIAIPGGRLRIDASSTGEDVDHGAPATGEVVYEGPNVMLGYAERREDLAAGDELHGVLRTGDIGYLDDEGFLFLTGRSKRIAKIFGLRVNLDEVEMMLRESGPAAVIAGDDVIRCFCAFGTAESVAELRETLSRRLRIHRSALDLRIVTEIPVSTSGKIDYRQVERWIPG